MFAISVRFDLLDEESAATFDGLLARTVPGILAEEPGTLAYDTYRVEGAPLARLFHEVYADRDAHRAHEARPATAAFLARVPDLTTGVRVEFLTPLTD